MIKSQFVNAEFPEKPGYSYSINASPYYQKIYASSFPSIQVFIDKYQNIPSILTLEHIDQSFMNELSKLDYEIVWRSDGLRDDNYLSWNFVYAHVDHSKPVLIHFGLEVLDDKIHNVTIDLFYTKFSDIEDIIVASRNFQKKREFTNTISLVLHSSKGLFTRPYSVKMEPINIELNYGKKFVPVYNKIFESLSEPRGKGLVLFHGIPGSGKTSLIRYLATQLKKEVLFIPPNLATNISEPSFLEFLTEHANCVLIIEDAEKVIMKRDSAYSTSSDQGVSNILNLTDGLLSDCLGIQVIATFNTERDKIDEALLRKGRLIAEYKFDKLSTEEASDLLKHLGKDYTATGPMTLTEIYNIEEEQIVSQQERRQIGFNKSVTN